MLCQSYSAGQATAFGGAVMEDLATKIIPLVQMLIPGFITTMIFYWLADVKKPGQFERTVQALIGTGVITMVVSGIEQLLKYIGDHWFLLGNWTPQIESAWGVGLSVILGLGLAYASNHDNLYGIARGLGLTSRASYPEWIYSFRKRAGKSVVLTLLDGRRLFGYPAVWPTDPAVGHFLITQPCWMDDQNQWVEMPGIESYLISNSDVFLVEFLEN
jgi:hypothetical protein